MLKFILRRFAGYSVLIILAACLGYFLAASSLNPRTNYEGRNPAPAESVVDQELDKVNMNDKVPIVERFATWAGGVVQGDFGKIIGGESVNEEMGRRIGVSLRLLLIGSILGAVVGVLVGVISAVRQYKATDYALTFASFVILSTPVFLLATLLKAGALNINNWAGTQVFLYTGEKSPGLEGGFFEHATDRLQHLIVPTLSIALGQIAFYSRYQRNSMLDVLGSDYLRTAQAKGLRRRQALFRHGLRTALIPMATFFAFSFGLLLTGAVFTETIFSWNGMGAWFIDSIGNNNVNAVAAVVVFAAVLVLFAGLLADILYAALDPRVRVR